MIKNLTNKEQQSPQSIKRGRGRPRKIEQTQQGSEPSTQIVQSRTIRISKINLSANKKWLYGGLVIIIALIPTIYFYSQNKNTQKKLADATKASQSSDAVRQTVEDVGKLAVLPEGEQPTVATVSDLSKLQDQPFFAKAAIGDKVLVYTKAQKAILYRPTINKIVEMASLNSTNQSSP